VPHQEGSDLSQRAKVYLVGAGPGDPELLTRKALRVLSEADAVIYDRLVSAEVLALANRGATCIYAGKRNGQQEEVQNEIFTWILRLAYTVSSIVRLKSGDPMVFGRGGDELDFLHRHGFEVEVVPGVSSAIAGPGLAGIPLTLRGVSSSFAVVAGHRENPEPPDFSVYGDIDTLVVLMGVANRAAVAAGLIRHGRSPREPVAFLENVSTDRERVVESTLGEVAEGGVEVEAPAVFVIGKVVQARSRMLMMRLAETHGQVKSG
jgi:uroporphyrin-III C-methyltransferase